MKDQGLELIAINVAGDDEKTVKEYFAKEGFTFPAVKGGEKTPQEYGVQACPTNYLLDGEGKVLWRGVGFNESELRAALEKLGLK